MRGCCWCSSKPKSLKDFYRNHFLSKQAGFEIFFFFVPTMMARMNVVLGSKMTHKIQIRRSFLSFTRYLLTLGSDCPCAGVCCCARFYLSCCWVQACFGLGLLHGIIKITETQAAAAFRIGSIDWALFSLIFILGLWKRTAQCGLSIYKQSQLEVICGACSCNGH